MTLAAALFAACDLDPEPPQRPPLRIVSTEPAALDGGVATHPIGPPLSVTFDRLLAPSTLSDATVHVRSGALGVFGGFRYDMIRRRVLLIADARAFRPSLQYDLVVTADLRAWDGATLAAPLTLRFAPGAVAASPPRVVPSLAREVAPLLAARCATAGCHGGASPVMGLDLSSTDAILRTALGVPARERPAPSAAAVAPGDPRWGALVRVDPGNAAGQGRPEYSYLVYKVLGDGPVIGARMPPEGPPLTDAEAALIADWIAGGAPSN